MFNQYGITAASRSLPFGTVLKVVKMDNGRSVLLRINDRGPYVGNRIIDLSMGAADVIGMRSSGLAPVCVYREVQQPLIAEQPKLKGSGDVLNGLSK